MTGGLRLVRVALDVPLQGPFDYLVPESLPLPAIGQRVVVPWGRRRLIGLVQSLADEAGVPHERLRPIEQVLAHPEPLPADWWRLIEFAATYYHRSAGEIALASLPKALRTVPAPRSRDPVERWRKRFDRIAPAGSQVSVEPPHTTAAQQRALDAIGAASGFVAFVLHGVTGSGKTEVYLRWFAMLLAKPANQVLLLVPEIALTPALLASVSDRFPAERVAVLHSGLPDAERGAHWLAAAEGRARIVIGTRLAVLTPLRKLAGIVVDEEHDASYKQQEGVHYSARDLAVSLAAQRAVPIVLGSATPSLETWNAVRRGRYRLLELPARVEDAPLPRVRVVETRGRPLQQGLTPEALAVLADRLARGEQSLVFLNRRGFAPVLSCQACGWLSRCPNCAAYRVVHRSALPFASMRASAGSASASGSGSGAGSQRYRLVCHHCGCESPVPRACPECGNVDLQALGRGTQRLEEGLAELFPAARIARLDRDTARRRGAAEQVLTAAHAGEVDMLVGTQMLAKGHDFRRLSLVVVVDPDSALFAADFRAPERLFATLMQVAGRAGRSGLASEVLLQTRYPDHPLFAALARADYAGYAAELLGERHAAGLPPFVHQGLLRCEARTPEALREFLEHAASEAAVCTHTLGLSEDAVTVFDPVPMPLARKAGLERAQLLVESPSRPTLHRLLDAWLECLRSSRTSVRWQLEVDPLEI